MSVSSSPKRPSKFIEALPLSDEQDDCSPASPTPANELFFSILNEMDEFESRQQQQVRERGGSQSSFESISSANASGIPRSTPTTTTTTVDRSHTVKEGNRRSINFTRSSMDKELASRPRAGSNSGSGSEGENTGDKLARKFVGRLRALTGGRDKEMKTFAYPGT